MKDKLIDQHLIVQANIRLVQILVSRTCHSCKESEDCLEQSVHNCNNDKCYCYPIRPLLRILENL